MGTDLEIKERQKDKLHTLLYLKALNKGIEIKGLALEISKAKIGMNKEDISDVEQAIIELGV